MSKIVRVSKKPFNVGDVVKIVGKNPMRGRTGIIVDRKSDCDDGKVKAWNVKLDNMMIDIFWDDDLIKI